VHILLVEAGSITISLVQFSTPRKPNTVGALAEMSKDGDVPCHLAYRHRGITFDPTSTGMTQSRTTIYRSHLV
jgi:hypothetical protein